MKMWIIYREKKKVNKINTKVCYSKISPLQWNKFTVTYPYLSIGLCLEIKITTKLLCLNYINNTHTHRHQLMMNLDGLGWTSKQITTLLNTNNILKPRTQTPYTQKDVWMSIMKLKKREQRKTHTTIDVGDWELWGIRLN